MRGLLSFMIMYLLSKREMYGMEIAEEIGKRKTERPNPGTIYPALKELEAEGIIASRKNGRVRYYRLTVRGRSGVNHAARYFTQAYAEVVDDFRAGKF